MDDAPSPPTTDPGPPARRAGSLLADLRTGTPETVVAVAVTGILFTVLYAQAYEGGSDTYIAMGDHMDPDPAVYRLYFLSQAFGWTALLWSWGAVLLGLALGTRTPGPVRRRRLQLEVLHRHASLTTVLLMALHVVLLLGGNMGETLVEVFVPWTQWEGGRVPVAFGLAGFYGSIVLGLSYYGRARLGVRAWRTAHRLTVVTYACGVWHTLLYGSNVAFADDWVRVAVWLAQVPVAGLLLHRTTTPLRKAEPRSAVVRMSLRVAAAAVLAGVIGLLVSGSTGGRDRPAPVADPPAPRHHHHPAGGP